MLTQTSLIWSGIETTNILKVLESKTWTTVTNNKRITYINAPASFDIETSSFYNNGKKQAIMYIWSFAIERYVILGRTWEEFIELLNTISEYLELSQTKRFVIYVHNLPYEFQFMRKQLTWKKVFAMKKREPVSALTDMGIEFRCSYKLSGYSLAKTAENLHKYTIKKLVGELDYSKIRHSETIILYNEKEYCKNDVLIVTAYIQEMIEEYGGIDRIPLTKTGIVRNYCRKQCFTKGSGGGKQDIYTKNTTA